MNKLIILTLLLVLLTACSSASTSKNQPNSNTPGSNTETKASGGEPKIAVGDIVVAKWSANSFYEGKVESLEGASGRIAWSDKSSPSQVDLVDIYALPKSGAKTEVKVADIVLAKRSSGTNWNGAEVTNIAEGVIGVKYTSDGGSDNLPPEKIIAVSAATAANFKGQAGQNDFAAKAQAGSPVQPAGYRPTKGERVLAEWVAKSWYPARVQSVSGAKATIAWDDKSTPTELVFEKVVPFPSASNAATVSSGDYLLVKPSSATGKWDYAQVSGVAKTIEATMADGSKRTIKPGEYVLIK